MSILRESICSGGGTEMVKGIKLGIIALTFLITFSAMVVYIPEEADAAEYSFTVLDEEVFVKIRKDGKAQINYHFEFENFGSGFDVVDIGMPNHKYDLSTATASFEVLRSDGVVSKSNNDPRIRRSTYVYPGVEVHVNAGYSTFIILDFVIVCDWMVWESPNNEDLASMQFRPTWFGSEYQRGNVKRLKVEVNLPVPLDKSHELVKDGEQWHQLTANSYGTLLIWEWTNVSPNSIENGNADVGVAFPKGYVDNYYKKNIWTGIQTFFHSMFGIVYTDPAMCFVCCFVSIFVVLIVGLIVSKFGKSKDYFRPSISAPGAGPRTGLTAPEVAMVMEYPLDKVVEMIVYGMVKKGSIKFIKSNSETKLERVDPMKVTTDYETDIYDTIMIEGDLAPAKLKRSLETMIKATEKKMKGFSQRKTKLYYKGVIKRAWDEVKACEDVSDIDILIQRNGEWMALEKHASDYFPVYIHPYYLGRDLSSSNAPGYMARDFAESMTAISGKVVRSSTELTTTVVDTLHPAPQGGGGGGGGGCACACACACAGGGR